MAKFKAEITDELRQELNTFLRNFEMTRAEFLKLAVKAKEFLVANAQEFSTAVPNVLEKLENGLIQGKESLVAKVSAHSKKLPQTLEKASAQAKNTSEMLRPTKVKAIAKTKAGKAAKRVQKATAQANDDLQKILQANRELFEQFKAQAQQRSLSYTEYAAQLGFDIKQIQRIKSEKALSFVPKLRAALARPTSETQP